MYLGHPSNWCPVVPTFLVGRVPPLKSGGPSYGSIFRFLGKTELARLPPPPTPHPPSTGLMVYHDQSHAPKWWAKGKQPTTTLTFITPTAKQMTPARGTGDVKPHVAPWDALSRSLLFGSRITRSRGQSAQPQLQGAHLQAPGVRAEQQGAFSALSGARLAVVDDLAKASHFPRRHGMKPGWAP